MRSTRTQYAWAKYYASVNGHSAITPIGGVVSEPSQSKRTVTPPRQRHGNGQTDLGSTRHGQDEQSDDDAGADAVSLGAWRPQRKSTSGPMPTTPAKGRESATLQGHGESCPARRQGVRSPTPRSRLQGRVPPDSASGRHARRPGWQKPQRGQTARRQSPRSSTGGAKVLLSSNSLKMKILIKTIHRMTLDFRLACF